MPTSLGKGLRQAAPDQEATSRATETAATPDGREQVTELPRRRRRLLGNAPIRAKLVFILVVPLIAVLAFAGLRTYEATNEAAKSEQVQQLARLGTRISGVAHELQQERGKAANFLSGHKGADRVTFENQFGATDEAARALTEQAARLDPAQRAPIATQLDRVDTQLRNLSKLRATITRSTDTAGLALGAAAFRYTTLVNDLLTVNERLASFTTDRALSDQIRAAAAYSRVKEYASLEEVSLFEVLGTTGVFAGGQYREFVSTLTAQEAYLSQFANSATPAQRSLADDTITQSNVERSLTLEDAAVRTTPGQTLNINSRDWLSAMTRRVNLMRTVETQFGNTIVARAGVLRQDAVQRAIVTVTVVLLILILALVISLAIARSMVRPLVRLRSSALEVAYQSLPDVVRRLQDADPSAPRSATDPRVRPVDIRSSDEIGQVAQAFNAVHQEAVRVASEQAGLRQSVSTMFINLSRRSQLLVDRLIRLIDSLEQGERDPDRLGDLFKLDHLVTRMRRNDENLLVLAGADAGRRWTRPAPLVDVLRAATAEVEQYTRVKLGNVDDSVEVSAVAVNDVVHLVAELLENATSFSSPRTDVIVDARRAGDQAIIEIEDQGIGMSREQLSEFNERLAKPPIFDVTVSRMMGLFVVGRLASRHGIKVMLRSATGGGVLALVTLPVSSLHGITATGAPPALPAAESGLPGLPSARRPMDDQPTPPPGVPPVRPSGPVPAGAQANSGASVSGPPVSGPPVSGPPAAPTSGVPVPGMRAAGAPAPVAQPSAPPRQGAPGQPGVRPPAEPAVAGGATGPAVPDAAAAPDAATAEQPAVQADGEVVTAPDSAQPAQPAAPGAPGAPDRTTESRGVDDRRPPAFTGAGPESAADAMAVLSSSHVNGSSSLLDLGLPSSSDPTVEMPLPIFDAVESEWFRARRAAPATSPAAEPVAAAATATTAATTAATKAATTAPPPTDAAVGNQPPGAGTSPPVLPTRVAGDAKTGATAPQTGTEPSKPDSGAPRKPETGKPATSGTEPARPAAAAQAERPAAAPQTERPAAAAQARRPAAADRPGADATAADRPTADRPAADRPTADRPTADRPTADRPTADRPTADRPTADRPTADRPTADRPTADRPGADRPGADRPNAGRTPADRPGTPEPARAAASTPDEDAAAKAADQAAAEADPEWKSPADVGWEAAVAAAEPSAAGTTKSGLPKRVPMAHFVPGRVEQPAGRRPARHRSPEAVRGVLSSYRHGLEQGRQAGRGPGTALAGEPDEQEEM